MKLHIGCGTKNLQGWINIDKRTIKGIDLQWDILTPLPYDADTVDLIFNEHLLEHFTQEEGQFLLGDWYRVLKPGGYIRIAMPDLEGSVHKYLNGAWRAEPWVRSFGARGKTDGEYLNMVMRAWEHKFLYDYVTLEKTMKQIGFEEIGRQEHHKSSCPDLCNLECRTADESNLILEGKKSG